MQLELIRNGPGVLSIDTYNDFKYYSSGVYIRSKPLSYNHDTNTNLIKRLLLSIFIAGVHPTIMEGTVSTDIDN